MHGTVKSKLHKVADEVAALERRAHAADALSAELERVKERNHQHTYCAYCGQEFPVDTDHATVDVGKHIWECEKHPLAVLVESIEEKCKDLDHDAQERLARDMSGDLEHASGIHKAIDAIRQEIEYARRLRGER
jgi:hypothetical protein